MPTVTLIVNGAPGTWTPGTPRCRCSTPCATIWASMPRSSAAASGNAVHAPCCSTMRRCARARSRVGDAAGRRVVTAEGLGSPEKPHPVQAAFIAEQAAQCGYCTNGMVMSTVALLKRMPRPTREEAQQALAGNLCRCGSHDRVLRAVQRAAGTARA